VFQSTICWSWCHRKLYFKQRGHIQGKRTHGSSQLAAWSKVWVYGPFLAGIVGLSTVEGMDVACYCSVLSGRDLSDGRIMCAVEQFRVWCGQA